MVARLQAATAEGVEETVAAVRQEAAVQAMLQTAANLPAPSLDPVRKSTAANLHEVWELLGEDAATMVVTAEYFGQTAPADADHSGPLLGLAAACERVLYEVFFNEVSRRDPYLFQESQTLGGLIRCLVDATRRHPRTAAGSALAAYLAEVGIAREEVRE